METASFFLRIFVKVKFKFQQECTIELPIATRGSSTPLCNLFLINSSMYTTIKKVLIVSVAFTAMVAEQCRYQGSPSKAIIDEYFAR